MGVPTTVPLHEEVPARPLTAALLREGGQGSALRDRSRGRQVLDRALCPSSDGYGSVSLSGLFLRLPANLTQCPPHPGHTDLLSFSNQMLSHLGASPSNTKTRNGDPGEALGLVSDSLHDSG